MIHPRRLTGTAGNIARYYTVGDYYSKSADEDSQWGGRIATELGLEGRVDPDIFKSLLAGQVGGQQLGRHREGGIEHHPGWDFAVNAPKSVSIMALVSGDERIIAAHEKAVGVALNYLEEHASLRRRDEGKVVHETTGQLLYARFTEHASRELDPHLHTHVVVMNMTRQPGTEVMASLETRAMFTEQMSAGQAYRNELAFALRELGYDISFDPRRGLFEIEGVPGALVRAMSQRAEQIEKHASEHGLEGQAARRQSFYETRGAKVKVGVETLHTQWQTRAAPFAHKLAAVRDDADSKGQREISVEPALAARATLFGLRQSESREAVNNLGRLLATAMAAHVGEVRLSDVRPLMDGHEARRKLLATREPTGDQMLTRGRTSRKSMRLEQALVRHLALAVDDGTAIASSDRLLVALDRAGLTPAQEQALAHMATARDRVTGLHGVAGAGKSMLIKTLNEAAEPGTTLIALAPTSSAAANLGDSAGIASRTVASLLAGGGHAITNRHVLVLDEAGQLGSRQALRVLEISRTTGARLIMLGDNKQTGAIEQGKAFWLMQQLGLPTAQLGESQRQQTRTMKLAVTKARAGDFSGSLAELDKVVTGESAEVLAKGLVAEWTRLKPENRATTNILVLDNATRLIVNSQVRETLRREGALAAEDSRLQILAPAGLSDQEKQMARFYSRGQVVTFARDNAATGIAQGEEYRVTGLGRDAKGRQIVRLVDAHGRTIRFDPRLARPSQVNVFEREDRDLAQGDRIQWRLASHALELKNAQRGTIERIAEGHATIRWDRGGRVQTVDLNQHKTWDHGYAETVYSAQSKTYARAYVLAPVQSPLVNAQNYYTAITRAQFGIKLWTEDEKRLVLRLEQKTGEKSSALEGLGRIERDHLKGFSERHKDRLLDLRSQQGRARQERSDRALARQLASRQASTAGLPGRMALAARTIFEALDRHVHHVLNRGAQDRPASDPSSTAPQHRQERENNGPER